AICSRVINGAWVMNEVAVCLTKFSQLCGGLHRYSRVRLYAALCHDVPNDRPDVPLPQPSVPVTRALRVRATQTAASPAAFRSRTGRAGADRVAGDVRS